MAQLSREQFLATFDRPQPLPADATPPFDFWPYFEAIAPADFAGSDCSNGVVDRAWRMTGLPYEHVLVSSDRANVFMVLVIDHQAGAVVGHRLLDLEQEYGLVAAAPAPAPPAAT